MSAFTVILYARKSQTVRRQLLLPIDGALLDVLVEIPAPPPAFRNC